MKSKEPIIFPVLTWDSEEKSLQEGGGGGATIKVLEIFVTNQ